MSAAVLESDPAAESHGGKRKWPRSEALAVARDLLRYLQPLCERILVAGSLRRGKAMVGDVELVYIPRYLSWPDPSDLFGAERSTNVVDHALSLLLQLGVIRQRLSSRGTPAWGPQNKLAVHTATGIPVDLFSAARETWWNYVVCRTGGAENNTRIAQAAIGRGWQWHPYGRGFTDATGQVRPVTSEREVYELLGLTYLEPRDRP